MNEIATEGDCVAQTATLLLCNHSSSVSCCAAAAVLFVSTCRKITITADRDLFINH